MSLYKIEFTQIATKTVAKYKKSNPVQYKKLVKLLNELMEHPRTGTGHPERFDNIFQKNIKKRPPDL